MLIDDKNKYILDQDMSGANGTVAAHYSGAIDHEVKNVGVGHPLILNLQVQEDIESGGAATVVFALQDSADGVTFTDTEVVIPSQPVASLVQGWKRRIALPESVRQHTRIRWTVGTAALTAGTMAAFLTEN